MAFRCYSKCLTKSTRQWPVISNDIANVMAHFAAGNYARTKGPRLVDETAVLSQTGSGNGTTTMA